MLINKKKDFNPIGLIDSSSVKKAFDIPGFATKEDMIKVINSNKIKYWDAPNYYIESGDLRDISTIKNFLT